jgi:serine/threonine protein kinase
LTLRGTRRHNWAGALRMDQGTLEHGAPLPAESAPRFFGPYRLLERIGEGGMGEVWLAEQAEPVRRRVALKFIKLGMDTRRVLARFESERQALALMEHPAVARVLDGGAGPDGRPFFAMDYVSGVPITVHRARRRSAVRPGWSGSRALGRRWRRWSTARSARRRPGRAGSGRRSRWSRRRRRAGRLPRIG